MCFSATASFSAGAVLTGLGAVSLSKASSPREYPFASIPLLFGIQQITEGFVWLSMTHPDYAFLQEGSMWFFLLERCISQRLQMKGASTRSAFGMFLTGLAKFWTEKLIWLNYRKLSPHGGEQHSL